MRLQLRLQISVSTMWRAIKTLQHGIVLLACVALLACSNPGIEDHYDEYLSRLARVLERDMPDWQRGIAANLPLRYPDTKQRQRATEDTRLGLFDFLSLGDCDLLNLVSERNSSLGKVMSVTARYQYERMLLNGLNACLDALDSLPDDEDDVLVKIDGIRQIKAQELPIHYWNATWGSAIFQAFFALPHPVLADEEVSGMQPEVVESLHDYFHALSQDDASAASADHKDSFFASSQSAERYLQPLQYHYGGRLIRSLVSATAAIEEGTRLLEDALAERPICYNKVPSRKAEVLNNVFIKYYVLALQPYLSRLDKEASLLLTVTHRYSPHDGAEAMPEVLAFYDTYLNLDQDNVLHKLRRAVKAHALTWNQLLRDCGMRVGGNPDSI